MINGIAPVIVFTFPDSSLLGSLGIPTIFPVYLDENITEVAADDSTQSIKIDTQVFKDVAFQRKVAQTITLKMRFSKNNLIGSVLVSLMSQIYTIINSGKNGLIEFLTGDELTQEGYFVSVYHDSDFMLRGYLSDFNKRTVDNTNMYEVTASFVSIPFKLKPSLKLPFVENVFEV